MGGMRGSRIVRIMLWLCVTEVGFVRQSKTFWNYLKPSLKFSQKLGKILVT